MNKDIVLVAVLGICVCMALGKEIGDLDVAESRAYARSDKGKIELLNKHMLELLNEAEYKDSLIRSYERRLQKDCGQK